jgi:hypothetical protein
MIMTDKRSVADRMVFSEVTHDNWHDFEGLFECRGGPKACWCMVWRATPAEAKPPDGLTRKAAMKARITAGTTVGLLGYLNKEPVAWCSVAPAQPTVDSSNTAGTTKASGRLPAFFSFDACAAKA